ncbi:MAG: uridine kinase [Lachnospiraceae bacterium]|jgi:uridine kinase
MNREKDFILPEEEQEQAGEVLNNQPPEPGTDTMEDQAAGDDSVVVPDAGDLTHQTGKEGDILVIGIAGGTGSGKSTLTQRIVRQFGENITVIHHDDYYKAHNNMTLEERSKLNYDHPNAFDTDLLIEHLKKLKAGKPIKSPIYDFTIHNRSQNWKMIYPSSVIIVEGILIFSDQRLVDMMDIKIFVDTDADIRLIRRIKRDVQERARTLDSVINQYLSTVKPMHEQFVEPSKKNADIIVPTGGKNSVAMEMIENRIEKHLERIRQKERA